MTKLVKTRFPAGTRDSEFIEAGVQNVRSQNIRVERRAIRFAEEVVIPRKRCLLFVIYERCPECPTKRDRLPGVLE
jgi:hypothetical protein